MELICHFFQDIFLLTNLGYNPSISQQFPIQVLLSFWRSAQISWLLSLSATTKKVISFELQIKEPFGVKLALRFHVHFMEKQPIRLGWILLTYILQFCECFSHYHTISEYKVCFSQGMQFHSLLQYSTNNYITSILGHIYHYLLFFAWLCTGFYSAAEVTMSVLSFFFSQQQIFEAGWVERQ